MADISTVFNMKTFASTIAAVMAATAFLTAGPLPKESVPAQTKWLLHLDLEKMRTTQVGQYFEKENLGPKLAKAKAGLKQFLDFDLEWEKITSITLFGAGFNPKPDAEAALLLKADNKVAAAFEASLLKQVEKGKASGGPITQEAQGAMNTYAMNHDVFIAIHQDGRVLLSKSHTALAKAIETATNKAANMTSSASFAGYPDKPDNFFLIALAEGFSNNTHLPPNAKILQSADGCRAVLNETPGKLGLCLTLKAQNDEACQQMQQVAQGLIALSTLSQTENKDLLLLTQAASISTNNRMVTVSTELPVSRVLEKLGEAARKEHAHESSKANGDAKAEADASK